MSFRSGAEIFVITVCVSLRRRRIYPLMEPVQPPPTPIVSFELFLALPSLNLTPLIPDSSDFSPRLSSSPFFRLLLADSSILISGGTMKATRLLSKGCRQFSEIECPFNPLHLIYRLSAVQSKYSSWFRFNFGKQSFNGTVDEFKKKKAIFSPLSFREKIHYSDNLVKKIEHYQNR